MRPNGAKIVSLAPGVIDTDMQYLYSDGEFARQLAEQFEGDDLKIEFYMAPPALVKPKDPWPLLAFSVF